jgi:DNA-binding MarR family transcriptional regulator
MALDPILAELARTQRLLSALIADADGASPGASHAAVLEALRARPGLTGADLARAASITPQAMNEVVRRLEQAGEVTRRPHAVDKRKITYEITEAGRAAITKSRAARRRSERRLSESWPPERRAALLEELRAANDGLARALRPAGASGR